MTLYLLAALLLVATALARQKNGFDLSYYQGDVSSDVFDCLVQNGYDDFAIFEVQCGSKYNTHAADDLRRANDAGIDDVDFYIFPTTSKDPVDQVTDTINKLKDEGVLGGFWSGPTIYIDVENTGLFFSSCADNVEYIHALVDTVDDLNHGRVGIYSSPSQWSPITCDTHDFADLPLWWARYDSNPDLEHNWSDFGGWTECERKQYEGDLSICGTDVDLDSA